MVRRWIDALAARAGPFSEVARRFDARCGPFEAGVPGLRRLAAVVDAADLPTEEADRQFVEEAGAMLAMFLLDALPASWHRQREGRHGLQIGARGYLDPFAALEASLDADDVQAEIDAQVARARAEAEGTGPVARVVGLFEQALATGRPERSIAAVTELVVALDDGTEVDLSRLARLADAEDPGAGRLAADRLVAMLPGGPAPGAPSLSPALAAEHLLPRLVGDAFLEGLDARAPLCTRPLGHDVHVALVLAFEGRARYVRHDEVVAWGMTPPDARRLALRNLAGRSAAARFGRADTEAGPIVVAHSGDGLDAARLLLPGLFDVLSAELSPPLLATVPHRDTLIATSGADPRCIADLRRRADDAAARAPHRISHRLFEVRPEGVVRWTARRS